MIKFSLARDTATFKSFEPIESGAPPDLAADGHTAPPPAPPADWFPPETQFAWGGGPASPPAKEKTFPYASPRFCPLTPSLQAKGWI